MPKISFPTALTALAALFLASLIPAGWLPAEERPNIILIMTDDQGIGDLGVMGNRVIETPHLDALAGESAWLNNFYVHPVCAPTRACLMTGRYNYRTRVVDTYIGRAMMDPGEVTLAEVLQRAGFATGIFGKWHLGDCYPMRAQDQGFDTTVLHRGGGIGQPSDPPAGHRQYTNPVLFRNGVQEQFQGYCTDIYYREAIRFIERSRQADKPFFVYLPDNTPHGPFHDVPDDLYQHYLDKNITRELFGEPPRGHAFGDPDADFLSRVYAMISNVDRNVGRLLARLDELNLAENTIVIFMCDNGPNSRRYVAGYRGHKGSVYEGGIRSPFFIRWPAKIRRGYRLDTVAAHIDVMPTLLGLTGVPAPAAVPLDGLNLAPQLLEETSRASDRNIFIQSHRGDAPVRYHHVAVRNQNWKLVHPSGFGKETFEGPPDFELYDMVRDPLEENDVADQHPDIVRRLREACDEWFDDVSSTRPDNYACPRIVVDAEQENPLVLTRQDWRRTAASGWGRNGHWLIHVPQTSRLTLHCRLTPGKPADEMELVINGRARQKTATTDDRLAGTFEEVILEPGDYDLAVLTTVEGKAEGAYQIEIKIESER